MLLEPKLWFVMCTKAQHGTKYDWYQSKSTKCFLKFLNIFTGFLDYFNLAPEGIALGIGLHKQVYFHHFQPPVPDYQLLSHKQTINSPGSKGRLNPFKLLS
jgi:hypothetical protein